MAGGSEKNHLVDVGHHPLFVQWSVAMISIAKAPPPFFFLLDLPVKSLTQL
ncbi:predicted protein [Botrytis cinerea T4]|uniref:Uncharacterized protein n=1 Tax=Botryotinia fuckeliana (strain T4) TaxID=999810 RepID=G2XWT6_BOTF4|nr:predicted protein [Botrytis cinerea T4]